MRYVMFQSTRPVRGATKIIRRVLHEDAVSIHAPRAGRDMRIIRDLQKV